MVSATLSVLRMISWNALSRSAPVDACRNPTVSPPLPPQHGDIMPLQLFFGLVLAALLLHEPVAWTMIAATALVVSCVAFARRYA